MLYEFTLKVPKLTEDGQQKEAREHYICDAELHGEAEAIGYGLYPGEGADVVSVGRSDVKEIINDPSEGRFCYKATVVEAYTDESGREKEVKYPMLLFADDFSKATALINARLGGGTGMTLDCLKRVRILDYLRK